MQRFSDFRVVGGKEHAGPPNRDTMPYTESSSSTARDLAMQKRPGKPKEAVTGRQEAEMENVTPAHLNAEIKAVERLVESRYVELRSGIEKIAASIEASQAQNSKDMARVERSIEGNFSKLDQKIDQRANDNNRHYRSIFWSSIVIAITAVAAIIATNGVILQAISIGQSAN